MICSIQVTSDLLDHPVGKGLLDAQVLKGKSASEAKKAILEYPELTGKKEIWVKPALQGSVDFQ